MSTKLPVKLEGLRARTMAVQVKAAKRGYSLNGVEIQLLQEWILKFCAKPVLQEER